MALWQFKVEVVPTERVSGRAHIDAAEFEDACWWSDRQPPSHFRERLASLLPPVNSWHERLLWYGSEQSDRIDVWMEQDRVRSIDVRIDCIKANPPFVKGLLLMVQHWSCSLVEQRYLKVLPATLPEFLATVTDSPSCRFMEDPAHWLPKLAAEVRAAEAGR